MMLYQNNLRKVINISVPMDRYNKSNPKEVWILQLEVLSYVNVGLDGPFSVVGGAIKLIHLNQNIMIRIFRETNQGD